LVLGETNNKIIHIVVSSVESKNCYIITAYLPEAGLWNEDFTLKK